MLLVFLGRFPFVRSSRSDQNAQALRTGYGQNGQSSKAQNWESYGGKNARAHLGPFHFLLSSSNYQTITRLNLSTVFHKLNKSTASIDPVQPFEATCLGLGSGGELPMS